MPDWRINMSLKKYNKNIKHRLAGLIAVILTVVIFSACSIFPPTTNLYFDFYNSSSYDVVVEYEGIESEGIDTVFVLQNANTFTNLLFYSYDGRLDEPSEDDFSTYLHYFKVFIADSLVYAQDPADISLWPQPYIREDDNITGYHYTFTFRDSLISYEQIP